MFSAVHQSWRRSSATCEYSLGARRVAIDTCLLKVRSPPARVEESLSNLVSSETNASNELPAPPAAVTRRPSTPRPSGSYARSAARYAGAPPTRSLTRGQSSSVRSAARSFGGSTPPPAPMSHLTQLANYLTLEVSFSSVSRATIATIAKKDAFFNIIFFEIYKIGIPLHRSDVKNSTNFHDEFE